MRVNLSFTRRTIFQGYSKLVVFIAENPNCTWHQIHNALYGDGCVTQNNRDVLRALIAKNYVCISGKNGRRDTYCITTIGNDMYNDIISTKDVCEFIDFAKKYRNFCEWKIEAVLNCHGDWTTKEFYYDKVYPIMLDRQSNSAKAVSSMFRKLPIYKDYLSDVTTM